MFEFMVFQQLFAVLRDRVKHAHTGDEGSIENIIWIALGAIMAITAVGIIATKVIAKANSVQLG